MTKVINKGKVHYTLELYSRDEIYSKASPVKLLSNNGRTLIKDVEAMIPDGSTGTKTFARLYLNQQDASILATTLVNEFKLGDAHETMPTENAENLYNYFKALLNVK